MAGVEVEKGKHVQELVENGIDLPNNYIWESANFGIINASVPLGDIPVIDISQLTESKQLDQLQSALGSWGCFQAINHGIENSLVDEIRRVAKEFFQLPMIEKQKYARKTGEYYGYGNDMIIFQNQTLDWNDRLYLSIIPVEERKFQYWPQNPESFRRILHEYSARIQQTEKQLLKAMARSLCLEEDCFLKKLGERRLIDARFNFYPPCPRPDLALGIKPHADGSAITFLLQDKEVEGLQVMKDDRWFHVPIIPYALLVIVGDQMEIMTNGIFKSPVHTALANSKKERHTLVIFCTPEPGKEIEPVGELINDKRPRLYKAVRNYMDTYFNFYQQAKRPIDAAKF
ncbi:2-oxoglutarate (2OG) and Fe(II)-dependent oxygenase superfamily protein [Forsythia ovata]|uniref:2-oxoglutarate (2OG) and Fe(II)-dependent oxygenase superfamily protein n=1 Tax=Forsythia ovata TaxID=205694 RepID=A0ABD1R2S7_9LAMI